MTTSEIAPCPFCGGRVEYIPELMFPGRYIALRILACLDCPYKCGKETVDEALAAHNYVSEAVQIRRAFDIEYTQAPSGEWRADQ